MKLIILLFFIPIAMFSQQSQRYLEFMNKHRPVDSSKVTKKYRNGNIKETGKKYVYEYEDCIYETYIGERSYFYKSGALFYKMTYDNLGIQISCIYYAKDGQILEENETRSIDSEALTLDDFFDNYNFDITTYAKIYYYSIKLDKYYLRKEGPYFNFCKSGIWKKYNPDGSFKKEKNYDR